MTSPKPKQTALLVRAPGTIAGRSWWRTARCTLDSPLAEPPLGLLLAGAKLSKLGFDCKLVDYQAERLDWGALTADLVRLSPGIVVISSSLTTLRVDLEAVREIRRVLPQAASILVGRELLHQEAAIHWDCPELTGIVSEPFLFASTRAAGTSLKSLKLQSRREANVIKVSSFAHDGVLDINKVPKLPYGLLNLARYKARTSRVVRLPVLASIGCGHACAYCEVPRLSDGVTHLKRPSGIVSEMLYGAAELGQNKFELVADNLSAPTPWWKDLISELSSARHRLSFTFRACDCEIPEELTKGLRETGCEMITLVLPAALNRAASELDWGPAMTEDVAVKKVKMLRKAGIGVCLCFVVGLLREDAESLRQAARLAARSGASAIEFIPVDPSQVSSAVNVARRGRFSSRTSDPMADHGDSPAGERDLIKAKRHFWLRPTAMAEATMRFGPRALAELASVLIGL